MSLQRAAALTLTLAAVFASCRSVSTPPLPEIPADLAVRPGVPPELTEETDRWVRHYWERVAQFREENAALDPSEECVVLLGDSLTEGWKNEDRVGRLLPPGRHYLNRGITSDHILGEEIGLLRRMDASVFDCHPSHVFFLMGVNDLARSAHSGGQPPVERIFGGYRLAVESIQERCPGAVVCLVTTTPVSGRYVDITPNILEFNALVRAMATERDLPLIDLFTLLADTDGHMPANLSRDGLHFNDEGFRICGEAIAEVLASH